MKQSAKSNRIKLVAGALAFTRGTPLEAGPYEQQLLESYAASRLTLAQVEHLLSQATTAAEPDTSPN